MSVTSNLVLKKWGMSEAPFRNPLLARFKTITLSSKEKHSSLLQCGIHYSRKKFISTGPC